MIKRLREQVIEEKVVEEIVTCDSCGKQTEHYIEAVTGHDDWGNDSCESEERHQFCSWNCAMQFMCGWLDWEHGGNNSDTAFIEFNQDDALTRGEGEGK